MTIKEFIKLSIESALEHILNYGDWDDVQGLFKLIDKNEAAKIFIKQTRRKRCNYRPEIKNYFNLYFKQ